MAEPMKSWRPGRVLFVLLTASAFGGIDVAAQSRPMREPGDVASAAFQARGSRGKNKTRPEPPDPIGELAERAGREFDAAFEKHDADENGAFDRGELKAAGLEPGLEFSFWDRDGDGAVSREEGRLAIDVAYGIRRADGGLLRNRAGLILDERAFQIRDVDDDGVLSLEEFSSRSQDAERAQRNFEKADGDGDGGLTFAEFGKTFAGKINVARSLERADVDGDGRLNREEFVGAGPLYSQWLAEASFDVFDENQDKALDIAEYAGTPHALRSAQLFQRLRDGDDDGRVSRAEFQTHWDSDAKGLALWYFSRFDRNGDGFWDVDEFRFRVNRDAVPRPVAFKLKDADKNGGLSLTEYFDRKPPGDDDARMRERYEMQLTRAEDAFLAADGNDDGVLSFEEFETIGDVDDAEAEEAAAEPVGAEGSHAAGSEEGGVDFWIIALIGVDVLVVLGLAYLALRRFTGRSSRPAPDAEEV